MSAPTFITWSSSTADLATPAASVATSEVQGTPKTILQIHSGAKKIRVVEWGYIFATTAPAPCLIELLDTGSVFATVTAGTIQQYSDATGPDSGAVTGTSATGYNATAEGTITATRLLAMNGDTGLIFKQQFPLGREPEVDAQQCLRVRATPGSSVAVNIWAYVVWEE